MKIAVPTKGKNVDDHFGHCEYYNIYTIENNEIKGEEKLPSPEGCGCKSNIVNVLKDMGVSIMLAGNIGEGAKIKLENCDIRVIRGCHGIATDIVKAYLHNEIKDSGIGCISHDNHDCLHNQSSIK